MQMLAGLTMSSSLASRTICSPPHGVVSCTSRCLLHRPRLTLDFFPDVYPSCAPNTPPNMLLLLRAPARLLLECMPWLNGARPGVDSGEFDRIFIDNRGNDPRGDCPVLFVTTNQVRLRSIDATSSSIRSTKKQICQSTQFIVVLGLAGALRPLNP